MKEEYNKSWKINLPKVVMTITSIYILISLMFIALNPSKTIYWVISWAPVVCFVSIINYYVIWYNINLRNEFIEASIKIKGGN